MSKENNAQLDATFISVELDKLEINRGQIDGLPANPRSITDAKMEMLKKDIQDYPEMLTLRGLIVYPLGDKYIIIGGNMRFYAMQQLGFESAPCVVIPKETTVEKMKAYTILDNSGFGKWDWDMLANEWDENMLTDWGVDLPIIESEINTDEIMDDADNHVDNGNKITVSLPDDMAGMKNEVKALIQEALAGYDGIKVG